MVDANLSIMKKLIFFIAIATSCMYSYAQADGKVYTEKSGKITYQYEIGKETTEFTLIFDNYGQRQVMDIKQQVDGATERVKSIITEESMFMVDFSNKQVVIFPVIKDDGSGAIDVNPGANLGIDVKDIVSNATDASSIETGTEIIDGKECKVYKQASGEYKGKYWIYKNHLLKAEFISEGVHTFMEAKEFELNIAIDNEYFEIPTGYTVIDMSKQMQLMGQ